MSLLLLNIRLEESMKAVKRFSRDSKTVFELSIEKILADEQLLSPMCAPRKYIPLLVALNIEEKASKGNCCQIIVMKVRIHDKALNLSVFCHCMYNFDDYKDDNEEFWTSIHS